MAVKRPQNLTLAIERGTAGFSLAWCLEVVGCAALIGPSEAPQERVAGAIAEFTAWAHQRSAEHADVDKDTISTAQVLETGADVAHGQTTAFFLHDAHAAAANEFPGWANAHDLAADQYRELVLSLPEQTLQLFSRGKDREAVLGEAARAQLALAARLRANRLPELRPGARGLNEAHAWLQQVVCDVDPALRTREEGEARLEEWSVRKVMRRSIWDLRYRTAVLRSGVSGLWTV